MKVTRAWTWVAATVIGTPVMAQSVAPPGAVLPIELRNAGFETGEPGQPPEGWTVPTPGTSVILTAEDPVEGRLCALLTRAEDATSPISNMMQTIDAAALRGRRIEVTASVRVKGESGARAQMWVRVDRAGGVPGAFDNMRDRPIASDAWTGYAVRVDVDEDAAQLSVGFFLSGGGARAWIDGVALRVLGVAGAGSAGPAPLAGRGPDNLVALARLLGVLRYFHPSSESDRLDWDDYTIRAVRGIESAADERELGTRLNTWMAPVAPTVRVWVGARDAAPPPAPRPPDASHVVGMRYLGYALPQPEGSKPQGASIYSASRVREPISRDDEKREIPGPGTSVTVDLGSGLWAIVPISLYADSGRTLPAATATIPETPEPPVGWSPSAKDRATRLAAVMLAWGALRHFSPYFDVTDDDWDAALAPALKKAAEDTGPEPFYRTLCLMLAHLRDGHGYVSGPGMPTRSLRDFTWEFVDDSLVVRSVGNSAKSLSPGDVVLEIDGRSVSDLYAEVAPTICAATEQWRRVRAAQELGWVLGQGTVKLTVRRAGRELGVEVSRATAGLVFRDPHPADGEEVAPGIAYFNLDKAETAGLMSAWPRLQAAKGVIFDLRGYPMSAGAAVLPYLTDRTLTSAQWNIPVITRPFLEKVTFEKSNWTLPPQQPRLTAQIAFLTGGGAISYAESCMGIVEAYKLGEIVGGPTAGTNGNVTAVRVPGGYSLSFTGMKVLKHDGSRHHGVGIQPTVPASPTVEGIAAGRDEVLDKAVEVLKAKIENAAASSAHAPAK